MAQPASSANLYLANEVGVELIVSDSRTVDFLGRQKWSRQSQDRKPFRIVAQDGVATEWHLGGMSGP